MMTRGLAYRAVQSINVCPNERAVTSDLSPAGIVEGRNNPDFNMNRIAFGSYALVYSGTTNRMDSRATPAISLYESNQEGGHYFLSLNSGKRLHSRKWVEIPISNYAESKVYDIATNERQPILPDKMPTFEWIPGQFVETNEDYNQDISVEDESIENLPNDEC